MPWNRWRDKYVSETKVQKLEEALFDNLDAYTFLNEIILRMSIDDKASYFEDIATDYEIEIEDEEE